MLVSQVRSVGGGPLAGSFPNLGYRKGTGWNWCGDGTGLGAGGVREGCWDL